MADTSNLTNYLKDIAKAIKKKKGIEGPILAANFDIEIETMNVGEGGIDTSDATATANDMVLGKTAYVNGEKVEGAVPEMLANQGSKIISKVSVDKYNRIMYEYKISTDTLYRKNANIVTVGNNTDVVKAIGLTSDMIVAGNTVLDIEGTASAGVLSEEEYNNLLLLTDDILTNPNVGDNETIEMFKLYPTMGPITEFAVASEYAPYGGSILFEEENAVRLEIIMEDKFQGRFLVYNDKYEHQPVSDSYAGVTASGIEVTGGHIADIDTQYYYFKLNGLYVEFETVSYHTFDNYLDIIDSIKIIPRNGVDNGDVATVSVEYTIGPISKLTVPQRYAESATSVAEESNMVKCSITTNNGWDGTFTVYDNTYELDRKANQDCGVTPLGIHVTGGTGVEDYPYYYWQVSDNVYVEFTTSESDIFSNILDFVDSVEIIPDEFLTVNFDSGMLSSVTFNKTKTKFEFVEESSSTDYSAMTIIATDGLTRQIRFDYLVYNPYAGILDIKTLDTYKGIEIKQATRDFAWFQDGIYVNMLLADTQGVTLDDVKFYIDNLSIVARTTSPDGGTWSEETIPGPEDEGGDWAPDEGGDWAPDLGDAELDWN